MRRRRSGGSSASWDNRSNVCVALCWKLWAAFPSSSSLMTFWKSSLKGFCRQLLARRAPRLICFSSSSSKAWQMRRLVQAAAHQVPKFPALFDWAQPFVTAATDAKRALARGFSQSLWLSKGEVVAIFFGHNLCQSTECRRSSTFRQNSFSCTVKRSFLWTWVEWPLGFSLKYGLMTHSQLSHSWKHLFLFCSS